MKYAGLKDTHCPDSTGIHAAMAVSQLYHFPMWLKLNNYVAIVFKFMYVGRDALWLVESVRHGGTAQSGQGPP